MDRRLYTASARLGLWDTVFSSPEDCDALDRLLQSASHGVVEAAKGEPTADPALAAVTAICDKLIARGSPTLVDLDFERALLTTPMLRVLRAREIAQGPTVGIQLPDPLPYNIDDLVRAAGELLTLPYRRNGLGSMAEPSLPPDLKRLTSPEEDHFLAQFSERFGARVQGHIHRQVRIGDLVDTDANRELADNRVDFAFRLGELRWVFEIDGSQHTEPGQQALDRKRDELLASNGWPVHRVSAQGVRNGQGLWPEQFACEFHALAASDFASIQDATTKSQLHALVFYCVLLPLAVHRCLRGLLHLYLFKILDANCEQRILVLEEDIPVTAEAFRMINALWSRLQVLAPTLPPSPRVHLEVMGEPLLPNLPKDPDAHVNHVAAPTGDYDAVISHSFLLAEGYPGALEQTHFPSRPANLVRLRRAIGLRSERALQPSESISYDLGDGSSQELPPEKHDALRFFLQLIFRKRDFREGQLPAIARLLQGKPTIVLLPTGGGKSLIYQLSGLLLPGMTIIIDPIVALMNDQVANLRACAIDLVGFISASLGPARKDAVLKEMSAGRLAFIFISPERLQQSKFRSELKRSAASFSVSLAVIDEAHCVSEWGHDFRPSYLHLQYNLQRHCAGANSQLPTLVALTGTASFAVLADVQREIQVTEDDAMVRTASFDRPELLFDVKPITKWEKPDALIALKEEIPFSLCSDLCTFYAQQGDRTNGGIIFCPHINSDLGIVEVSSLLGHVNYFAGERPKNFPGNWDEHKKEVQEGFRQNELQEIVATKAFGMGIDKPNIRYTIHYAAPQSVEAFYQEAGRAGRDGNFARSTILYSNDNRRLALGLLDDPDNEQILQKINTVAWDDRGDLLVQLYFLLNSYKGRKTDKKSAKNFVIADLMPVLANMSEGKVTSLCKTFHANSQRTRTEYIVYRLMLLGIVQDYTINWQREQIEIALKRIKPDEVKENLRNYLERYKFASLVSDLICNIPTRELCNTIECAIDALIDFIYTEIVAQRKQALRTMDELCHTFTSHEDFRDSILAYLQESKFSKKLGNWIGRPFIEIGLTGIHDLYQSVDNELAERHLFGAIRRMLDQDPQNVALRYLSFYTRIRSANEDDSNIIEEACTVANLIEVLRPHLRGRNNYLIALRMDGKRIHVRTPDAVLIAMLQDVKDMRPELLARIGDDGLRRAGHASLARRLLNTSLARDPAIRSRLVALLETK